jgi:hypothetical protein
LLKEYCKKTSVENIFTGNSFIESIVISYTQNSLCQGFACKIIEKSLGSLLKVKNRILLSPYKIKQKLNKDK